MCIRCGSRASGTSFFKCNLLNCNAKLSPKSDTSAAIRYVLSNWETLARYCDDGSREIDNSAAGKALRAVSIRRKNHLFAGSDRGGERAATFYGLIGTAKLNGLDPEAYLRSVLTRIADHPVSRIQDLLPWSIGLPTDRYTSRIFRLVVSTLTNVNTTSLIHTALKPSIRCSDQRLQFKYT